MYSQDKQKSNKQNRLAGGALLASIVLFCYVTTMLLWPIGAISASIINQPVTPAGSPPITWPVYGQSALYADGYGLLGTKGVQTPIPIASITKVVTALTVLQVKPITDPTQSPLITFTAEDVERYNRYLAQDGVVAPLTPGNTISQYDMMQIMLIASANNYAESLAVWAFGSVDAYLKAAKEYLASKNLNNTAVMDPAGFSTGSSSTAADLAELGQLVIDDTTVAAIVAKPSVTVDGVGAFYTTNLLVANGTAIGVKTGNTDEAGQCLLFAQRPDIDGTKVTITGAILGGESRSQVAASASALLDSGTAGFVSRQFAAKNQVFAVYTAPWGATAKLQSTQNTSTVVWLGDSSKVAVNAPPINPEDSFVPGAKATITAGEHTDSTGLTLDQPLGRPSVLWRLTHPVKLIRSN